MKTSRIILRILREEKKIVIVAVLLLTLSSMIEAGLIITVAPIIDLIINPDLSKASRITVKVIEILKYINLPVSFMWIAAFYFLTVIIKSIIMSVSKFIYSKLHYKVIRKIIFDEFNSFLSASWQFFVSNKYGVLTNTLVTETTNVGHSFSAAADVLSKALGILFCILVAFLISWKLTVIVLLLVGISLIPFSALGRITYKIGGRFTTSLNDFQGLIIETFSAAKLILGFGNQQKSISRLSMIMPIYIRSAIQFIMIRTITPLAFEPIGILIMLFAVYLGVYRFKLDISEVFIMLYTFKMSSQYALYITNQKNILLYMGPSLEQIYNLKKEAERIKQPSGDKKFQHIKKEIRLIDISFSYPSYKNALKDINIVIPKGKMIAIIGNSGSGKTTLVDIIMGFYQIDGGQYLLDGVPFGRIDINSWRKKIGYVPQEAFLFNMSIRDNLLWSNEEATEEEMFEACEIANANEFIGKLAKRFDTVVGEQGLRLSGGQRQRIALARAILRKPEVLILDEATSSLDSHSELMIQESIDKIAKYTTIIVIAHRLSTIKKSDYIYVLDNGYIVEEGTVDNLIVLKDGEFLKMAKLQGMVHN